MDFKQHTSTTFKVISFLTLASTILLLLSFMFSFDALNGYFTNGLFPVLFEIAFILGIILSLVSAFAFDKHKIIKTSNSDHNHSNTKLVLAVLLVICAAIFNFITTNFYFSISLLGIGFLAIYTFLNRGESAYQYSHTKLMCLLLSLVFPIVMNFDNGLVVYRHSNSVENTLTSVFVIAYLIYILYEGNRIFSRAHSRWHFPSMLLFTHTGFSLSVSYIIAYFTYDVNEKLRFYQMILIFILSLLVEIEVIRFVKKADSHTQIEWDEIEAPKEGSVIEDQTIHEENINEENINEEKTDE